MGEDGRGAVDSTAPGKRKFGLRGKLIAAFAGISCLTVIGSGVGVVAFQAVEQRIRAIVDSTLPTMTLARRLSERSATITVGAPQLLAATTDERRAAVRGDLNDQGAHLTAVIGAFTGTQTGNARAGSATAELAATAPRLVANIAAIDDVVRKRLETAARIATAANRLADLHRRFLETLSPLIESTSTRLRQSGRSLNQRIAEAVDELGSKASGDLIAAYELQGIAMGAAVAVQRAATADSAEAVDRILNEYPSALAQAFARLPRFEQSPFAADIADTLDRLLAFGRGDTSIFERRKAYLLKTAPADPATFLRVAQEAETLQAAIREAVEPLITATSARIVIAASKLQSNAEESIDGFLNRDLVALRNFLELAADGNLLVGLIGQASQAETAAAANTLRARFDATATPFRKHLDGLAGQSASQSADQSTDRAAADAMVREAQAILSLAGGDTDVFALRTAELGHWREGERLLGENRALAGTLATASSAVVTESEAAAAAMADQTMAVLGTGRAWLGLIAASSILVSVLIVWLYVNRAVVRRLTTLAGAMRRIAAGDLETRLPRDGNDEIRDMAMALVVFRDTARAARAADERAAAERSRAAEERRSAMLAMAAAFEDSVKNVADAVTTRANELHGTAQELVQTAESARNEAGAAAAAATSAARHVQSVAAAAEELSGSSAEIGRQVSRSRTIAEQAVSEAQRTDGTVRSLNDAVARIGAVLTLIQDIASQTNLLALNATIEAARAGEAGKGFAVVASEVKILANQTAKATEQIAEQIENIQGVSAEAVEAIRRIGQTVAGISEVAATIASAVEEQNAATLEIARSVNQAATGTSQVTDAIGTVSAAATQTGGSARRMLTAADVLTEQADALSTEVGGFLREVRAA